jgi:hypothetical protein
MLIFDEKWNEANNNNSPNKLSQDKLDTAIRAAITEMKTRTNDEEFLFLATAVESTSSMLKSYVMKGMHQETGNQILPETHCTVDVPDFPHRRNYHIWFLWAKKSKVTGWHAQKVSYEYAKKQYKDVAIF